MSNPLFNIQYGLFVITTCDGGRDNGCISNTIAQVAMQPDRISVALNKGNLTTELIQHSRKFTASIISEAADFELFKHFGFQSGREVDKFADFKRPEPTIAKSIGHHAEWLKAVKTGDPTTCNFEYSGRVAETILLGPVAYRCGKKLEYDAETMTVTNCPEAAKLLKQDVKKGWEV